jgi:hypothetical protein
MYRLVFRRTTRLAFEYKGDTEMAKRQQFPEDTDARDSFTFRRMTRGQLWAITIVAAVILAGLVVYASL